MFSYKRLTEPDQMKTELFKAEKFIQLKVAY